MTVKKGQELELLITDVAFGGKGLAKVDGFAVFVPQTIPGDRVVARVVKKKKNFAEARLLELIQDSADRISPPCPYSGICGGCTWQFLKYEKQLAYKRQHVQESIEHIGSIKGVPVHATIPSPLIFGYRNKMEFSCSDRRWLMADELGLEDVDQGFALGLHVQGTFYKVLDIQACLLQPDFGNRILGIVRDFIRGSGVPAYSLKTHSGFWRFLVLRHSVAFDQWMVNIVTAEEKLDLVRPLADLLIRTSPEIVSVVNNVSGRKAGIAVGEYEQCIAGTPVLHDRLGLFQFEISSNSFFQTNTRGAKRLYETVKRYADLTGSETVIDLYSGTGTIPVFLSDSAREIVGLEIVEDAVADARRNCDGNDVSNCRFVAGDIRRSLSEISTKPDVMIIDPPRVGMHEEVVRRILEIGPERIVYVSCNPATLARDLAMMKDRYRVLEVQPVDMFPHTFHIESVAKLERR